MNLAILHYHLNRSGVTRVIENQLMALDAVLSPSDPWRVALVYGGRREGWSEDLSDRLQSIRLSLHAVAALDYDDMGQSTTLADDLTELLERVGFASQETILHVHNHALGKNVSLPPCLERLSDKGFALLLQIRTSGRPIMTSFAIRWLNRKMPVWPRRYIRRHRTSTTWSSTGAITRFCERPV
jgi:hypothetical protein